MRRFARMVGWLVVALLGAAFLLAPPASAQGHSCLRLGGDLVVPAGESCGGDAVAIGGDVTVEGTVGGNAVAVGGSVWVGGQVAGDVVSLGGEVVLQERARVDGSVAALGGLLRRAPGAVVQGDVLESGPFLPGWAVSGDRPPTAVWTDLAVGGLSFVLALGLCLAVALSLRALWPRRTQVTVATLRQQWLPSVGLGVTSAMLLAAVLPLVVLLLVITLVGALLLPFLGLLLILLYLAGLTVTGLALGEALAAWTKRPASWLPLAGGLVIVVLLAVLPGAAIPWLAPVWVVLLASGGVGAIILSRAGTLGRPVS